MDARTNPYAPGAGTRPPALRGRDRQIDQFDLLLNRLADGRSERSLLIDGLRGVGKTVLLSTFKDMAVEKGWYAAKLEVRHDTELRQALARAALKLLRELSAIERMKERVRRASQVLKSFSLRTPEGIEIGVGIDTAGTAGSGDLEFDVAELMLELGQTAQEAGTGVALLFDEIQFLDRTELEALIHGLHEVAQANLPLAFAGCGLPSTPALAGQAKTYAERLFLFQGVGSLDRKDAQDALTIPAASLKVRIDQAAVDQIIDLSDGYPYFLQEYGKHAWLVANDSEITAKDVRRAHPRVLSDLDDGFFSLRYQRATESERRYIRAIADLGDGPQTTADVGTALGHESLQQGSSTRADLIGKGLIFSPRRGQVDFTVPHFADYVRRMDAPG
jgi:hypothetical protein